MSNTSLFDDEPYTINPPADRCEPVIWVRRIRLVSSLDPAGEVIRDIEFRRGLNVICTAVASDTDGEVVGHSVGKTLLLRLIRYCLGEANFGPRPLRNAIAGALERAYVLAEVRVSGKPWVVARPIGRYAHRPASWARQTEDIDQLISGPDGAVPFQDYVASIEAAASAPLAESTLPVAGRPANWLDLLGWLARDQDCRFRYSWQWRDPDSESRTAQLQAGDAGVLMRTMLDLLDTDEKRVQGKHQELLGQKRDEATALDRLKTHLEREGDEVGRALEIDQEADAGEVFGAKAVAVATEQVKQLRRLLKDALANSSVAEAEAEFFRRAAAIVRIEQQSTQLDAQHEAETALLKQLEEADAETFYASLADLGTRWCRLFQAEQTAVSHGCPGGPPGKLAPGQKDPEQVQKIARCKQHIDELTQKLAALVDDMKAANSAHDQARREHQRVYERHLRDIGGIRQRIGRWMELESRARRYTGWLKELTTRQKALVALEKKIRSSTDRQQELRQRLESRRIRLSAHFAFVLRKLIGVAASGEVRLSAKGIDPVPGDSIGSGGQAIGTSAKVLGFDLACLVAYIDGVGKMPGLLIHDSPREADMEDSLYHRLFKFVAELEEYFGDGQPSFQYIVATTTPPPESLDREPYVRVRLDAREEEGLLLKRRLAVISPMAASSEESEDGE